VGTLYLIAKIMLIPLLVRISVKDIKTKTVSNAIQPVLLCAAIFLNGISPFERLIGGFLSAFPSYIYSHKTRKMGMGDVKLMFSFGWCSGLWNIPAVIFAWIIFYFTTLKGKNKPIPYAPYLCGTFALSLFMPYFI